MTWQQQLDEELYRRDRLPPADCSTGPTAELMRREAAQEWWRIAAEGDQLALTLTEAS